MLREKLKPAAIFHSLLEQQKVHHANTRIHRCTTHESQDWRLRKRAKNGKQVSLPVVELKSFVRWNFHCSNSPLTLYSRNFNSFSLLSSPISPNFLRNSTKRNFSTGHTSFSFLLLGPFLRKPFLIFNFKALYIY